MNVALFLRVSTTDQTTENQLKKLTEVCKRNNLKKEARSFVRVSFNEDRPSTSSNPKRERIICSRESSWKAAVTVLFRPEK
jgi:DNA invertase Pin-like site-specific DNA recombinase